MTPKYPLPSIEVPGRPARRNLSRHHLYASGSADTALMQPHARLETPAPAGIRAYSQAVAAVGQGFAPRKYDRYA